MKHLGQVSSSATCPLGRETGPSTVQGPEVSQAWVQPIPRGLGSVSEGAQTHSGTVEMHLASQSRNRAGWL